MLTPKTSQAMTNAISSPGSEDGPTRSGSSAGLKNAPSGRGHVPVSRFRALDTEKAMPTDATSGPLFTALSPSAGLQRSLESKLRQAWGVSGSPVYALTWSTWDMLAGLPICRLRASGRRMSASAFGGLPVTGWGTPTVTDLKRGVLPPRPHDTGVPLTQQVGQMAGWRTPDTNKGGPLNPESLRPRSRIRLSTQARLAGWGTPRGVGKGRASGRPERAHNGKARLEDQVYLSGWATPNSEGLRMLTNPERLGTVPREPSMDTKTRPTSPGLVNPEQPSPGGPWEGSRLVFCEDGKWRAIPGPESGIFPLAHGLPISLRKLSPAQRRLAALAGLDGASLTRAKRCRIGALAGYGNAIVPQVAAEFVRASILALEEEE